MSFLTGKGMVVQVPQLRAQEHDLDQGPSSVESIRISGWLQPVPVKQCPPPTFYTCYGKRAFDLVVAIPLLAFSILPMAIVALAVRLDTPGNPIFLQERVGWEGRTFTIVKFRTMSRVARSNLVLLRDQDGVLKHKVRNDPRVTRVGRILRKTSLDELPQLINVIKGDMSLVGPRPELPQIVAAYEPWQHERHVVRPGITGWWQVSGRSDRPMHEHTDLDMHYVGHLSPRLDAAIIGRTIKGVLRGIGAF